MGGAGAMIYQSYFIKDDSELNLPHEFHSGPKQFINPLLDCAAKLRGKSPKQAKMEGLINKIIERATAKGQLKEASVYFRDLTNGPVLGVNEDDRYIGASLMKIPIAIWYYHQRRIDPTILDRLIPYKAHEKIDGVAVQQVNPADPLVPGQSYSVRNLIERMLIGSDNAAVAMLLENEPTLEVSDVLKSMGVVLNLGENEAYISAENQASIFRILYNATYLDSVSSNELLGLLTKARFSGGIASGVPADVPVSHKFGERTTANTNQFHDCGIVYYPRRPYLLCIMSRGDKMESLVEVIGEIASTVFTTVNEQSK